MHFAPEPIVAAVVDGGFPPSCDRSRGHSVAPLYPFRGLGQPRRNLRRDQSSRLGSSDGLQELPAQARTVPLESDLRSSVL